MPILNYTTKVDPHKTVSEVQAILARKGALSVNVDYGNGIPIAVKFMLSVNDNLIPFRLPCNFSGVEKALLLTYKSQWDRNAKQKNPEFQAQVRRVAWRIIKDWIEAQMAIVEANQAEMAEVFLPYAMNRDGNTLYQHFLKNSEQMALPEGIDGR